MKKKNKVIVLTGPTGIGKTELSINIAKKYNLPIINGDAFQVYKDMELLTASPSKDEKLEVEHKLFNFLDPSLEFSIYDYQKIVREEIEKSDVSFITGGSGLYINSIIYDYDLTSVKRNEDKYLNYSNEELYNKLININSDYKDLVHENNRKRLIHYLELAENNELIKSGDKNEYYDVLLIILNMDRELLYERINLRFDSMVEEGILNEVSYLNNKYLMSKTSSQAIGFKEIMNYLNGTLSLKESINLAKENSRHLAKRQITWFKNKMNGVWVEKNENSFNEITKLIDEFLKR